MKTNLKKILAAILAISAVVSASGCNIVVDEDSQQQSDSTQPQSSPSDSQNNPGVTPGVNSPGNENSSDAENSSVPASSSGTTSTPGSSSSTKADNNNPGDGKLSEGILVFDNGLAISLYGGGKKTGQDYAAQLNKFKEKLGDVNVYSLVSPTSGSFYLPAKYKGYMASEKDNIDNINSHLSGVKPVDAYGALEKHKSEKIFMNTDHHWSALGAYYAAEELAKTADVPFAPLSEYVERTYEGYVGTMYGFSGENEKIKNNPEPFTYYSPKCDYTATFSKTGAAGSFKESSLLLPGIFKSAPVNWYLVFIGQDNIVTRVNTTVTNGRKLLIVKDSYGNAVIPCLLSSFEQIDMVDMRYFNGSVVDYAKENGITDLAFIMNTFSATGPNEKKLAGLL